MNEIVVFDLMRRYFESKNTSKAIKAERMEFMSNTKNKCEIEGKMVRYGYDENVDESEDCLKEVVKELCPYCKKRHGFYLRLKTLHYERVAILNKVRHLTKV